MEFYERRSPAQYARSLISTHGLKKAEQITFDKAEKYGKEHAGWWPAAYDTTQVIKHSGVYTKMNPRKGTESMKWYNILFRAKIGPGYWGSYKWTKAHDVAHAQKKMERVQRGYYALHPESIGKTEFTVVREDPKSWSYGKGLGHGKRHNPYSKKARYRHSKVRSKSHYDKRSFRTIKIGKHGRLLRVACPKGKWKHGRCSVGMKAQGLLTPKKYAKLLRMTRSRSLRHMAANRGHRKNCCV